MSTPIAAKNPFGNYSLQAAAQGPRTPPGAPSATVKRELAGLKQVPGGSAHWMALERHLEQHGVKAPSYRAGDAELTHVAQNAAKQPGFRPVSNAAFASAEKFGKATGDRERLTQMKAMAYDVLHAPFGAPQAIQDLAVRAATGPQTPEAVQRTGAELAAAINQYRPAELPKPSGWLSRWL